MGDWAAALGLLLEERGADLFGYAYLLTGSDERADALVRDAVTRTFRTSRGNPGLDSVQADVKRAIARAFLDGARRSTGDSAAAPVALIGASALDLRESLLSLPAPERVCVVLHYLDELPIEDVAATLKISEATAERYAADGVGQLRALHPETDFTEVFTIAVGDGGRW